MLPTTSYLPTVHYVQLLPVLGYLLLVLCFLWFFVLIPTYGTLCSVSNGTRYLLPTTYCIFCDFFGVKSNTYLRYITYLPTLDTCGIPYANTYGIPGNFTAKNTAEFRGISRNSVSFSKNSVFRRKSKTHFRGHPKLALLCRQRLLPAASASNRS